MRISLKTSVFYLCSVVSFPVFWLEHQTLPVSLLLRQTSTSSGELPACDPIPSDLLFTHVWVLRGGGVCQGLVQRLSTSTENPPSLDRPVSLCRLVGKTWLEGVGGRCKSLIWSKWKSRRPNWNVRPCLIKVSRGVSGGWTNERITDFKEVLPGFAK